LAFALEKCANAFAVGAAAGIYASVCATNVGVFAAADVFVAANAKANTAANAFADVIAAVGVRVRIPSSIIGNP
jgi:hypothetical protein